MQSLLIQNAHIIDPSQQIDGKCNVLAKDGRIEKIGADVFDSEAQTIDANGLLLVPGLIDMHVHLRDPGQTHKEDILSGCRAAAAGGFTAVACMPNTNPVCDSAEVVSYIRNKAKSAVARVYPIAAITTGLKSEQRTDMAALKAAGAVGVTDDGRPVTNNRLMLEALDEAYEKKMVVISHAEDLDIVNRGIMHKGAMSDVLGVRGIDRASEDCNTAAVIALAAAHGGRIHIAHVSTAGSVAIIRDAKKRGVQVTCETGPHYFTLTEQALRSRDANFRMNPPLREERDRQAILEGIADGTIDCIATDHAPHAPEEKADFEKAPNGVIGMESSLALCITHLVKPGVISMERLVEMMSCNPARILGVEGGSLKTGMPADMTLINPDASWVIDKNRFASKARNTCFDGMQVVGRALYTVMNGMLTYQLDNNR